MSQAALKLIRARGFSNNTTPLSFDDAVANVEEEFNDVLVVAELLGLKPNEELQSEKWQRWAERLGAND